MWRNGLTQDEWESSVSYENFCLFHSFPDDWIAKNFKDGDKVMLIFTGDDDTGEDAFLHCCLMRDGKYMDVRGETDDLEEVLDGLEHNICNYVGVQECTDVNEFQRELEKMGGCAELDEK